MIFRTVLSPFSGYLSASVLAMLLVSPDAHGYLDPGTGSLMVQGILAAIAAVAATAGLYWNRVKSFYSRLRPRGREQTKNIEPEQHDGINDPGSR